MTSCDILEPLPPDIAAMRHEAELPLPRCPLTGQVHPALLRCAAYPGCTVCVMCPLWGLRTAIATGDRAAILAWLREALRWLPRIVIPLFLLMFVSSMTACGAVHNGAHAIPAVEQAVRNAAPGGIYAVTEDGARLTALLPYEDGAAFSAWYKGSPCTTFIVTNSSQPVPWATALRRFWADAAAHGALKAQRLEVLGYFRSWTASTAGAAGSGLIGLMPMASWCRVEPWLCERLEAY